MARIENFEDLEVWQLARVLCKLVKRLISKVPFLKDFKFSAQINSAAGSCMDNIAEGFERDGNKEFINFLYISKGSNGEVRSQSYRALDWKYISNEEQAEILVWTEKLKHKLQGLINTLKYSGGKGYK
ncbi:four helix bundle protein [Algoriphagus aquaeductus]|uniref:Four helix bundle protein n=1 Tax=Algoriphagus aquaeductus TaxID=475299 RepID=A0A326RN50_9BACT|nr:four helix bundle protein [Algoriphagus aquaeductus]PZV82308.1 four helix bundle protein [Algoriphagus aquaeductus]